MCGDSEKIVVGLPNTLLVVTDPPYGVGFRKQGWDAIIPEIATKLPSMFPVCEIITAPETAWTYSKPDWVCCWTRAGATSRTTNGTFNHWSPILTYGTNGPNPDLIQLPGCGYPGQNIGHPSPKPLRLMEWLIKALPDGIILDPFCGSGTTLVAAKKLGRRYIGIEISEKYCQIARDRLEKTPAPRTIEGKPNPNAGTGPHTFF